MLSVWLSGWSGGHWDGMVADSSPAQQYDTVTPQICQADVSTIVSTFHFTGDGVQGLAILTSASVPPSYIDRCGGAERLIAVHVLMTGFGAR